VYLPIVNVVYLQWKMRPDAAAPSGPMPSALGPHDISPFASGGEMLQEHFLLQPDIT